MDYDAIKERLLHLDTACICDADKALGLGLQAMDAGLRPIRTGLKLVGRAHTVRCHDDFLTVIKALADAQAGEVIVIDSQGSSKALTGELFPTEALRKGLAGIVNDGPCRDTAVVRAMALPYYARSVTCVPGTTNQLFETQIPIQCGGVEVRPGDILCGDDDGVIVGSDEVFAQLIPLAEEIQRKEDLLLKGMAEGRSLLEMLNFDEHCTKIRAGEKSALEFRV
ncbi:MAG: RraA family protein [Candidatus Latescibacterota bacterium]|nr:RraA family protein [Candidatus Latescibacterota bacterium]